MPLTSVTWPDISFYSSSSQNHFELWVPIVPEPDVLVVLALSLITVDLGAV